jgi:transcriptional regulator with XRE-family HTH domain
MTRAKTTKRSFRSSARSSPDLQPTLEVLGRNVKWLREERGLTQEGAASLAGLDSKHWQDIEAGRVNVTAATLLAVSKALDVAMAALFLGL